MDNLEKNVKTIQSVHRALDILEFAVFSGNGQKLSTITEHCHLNKTTAFHLIKTLEARGYLEQSPDTLSYKTGGKVFELASKAYQNINLTTICQPYLEQLVSEFNETVGVYHYSKINGLTQVLCTSYVESTHPVRVSVAVGKWLPLMHTASGYIFLSSLSSDALKEILISDGHSSLSDSDFSSLKEKLEKIHTSGICLEQEEYVEGVVNIAVPIYQYTGRPIAAICVSTPVQRAQEELLNKMTEKLKKISREISSLPL